MDVKDKVCVVTGGADGIGRGIASAFARGGAVVVIGDRDQAAGQSVADELSGEGCRVRFGRCDVSDPPQAKALVDLAVAEFGGLDVLVNNAGIQIEKTIEELDADEWDQLMSVNMKGVFLCSKYALGPMRSRGGGSIVNIGSINGFWVEPGLGAYCASKGGVIALTRSTATDFGKDGIRCNCICPGFIDTGMAGRYLESLPSPTAREDMTRQHAVGRLGLPSDIASMAQFLASDAAGFVTGSIVVVDGGLSLGVTANSLQE